MHNGTSLENQAMPPNVQQVYFPCGDELAAHLMNVAAPAAGLPTGHAQQLVSAVREREAKDVKDLLRGFIMQQAEGMAAAAAAAANGGR